MSKHLLRLLLMHSRGDASSSSNDGSSSMNTATSDNNSTLRAPTAAAAAAAAASSSSSSSNRRLSAAEACNTTTTTTSTASERCRRTASESANSITTTADDSLCIFKCIETPVYGNVLPQARSGHRIVSDDGRIYLFGGYNASEAPQTHGLYPEVWEFTIATRLWQRLVDEPVCPKRETASHSMAMLGNKLLMFGGTGYPFGQQCSNSIYVLDVEQLEWVQFFGTGTPPSPRYGHGQAIKDGCMYIIGGTRGHDYDMEVWKLEFATRRWEQIPTTGTPPEKRYRHELIVSGPYLHVLGGGTSTTVIDFKRIDSLDTRTSSWCSFTTLPDDVHGYPCARKFHSAVAYEGDAYLCGGFGHEPIVLSDMWRLNLKTLKWTRLQTTLPAGVYFHAATVTPQGCMYIFGGVTNRHGNQRTNKMYQMWLTVPKLKDLAWEYVCNRCHDEMQSATRRTMRCEWKLPQLLVDRVRLRVDEDDINGRAH